MSVGKTEQVYVICEKVEHGFALDIAEFPDGLYHIVSKFNDKSSAQEWCARMGSKFKVALVDFSGKKPQFIAWAD
ncbi:MAG: hypothetical protein GF365_02140 [Candidatus Buchananbacteria bacterium]|nr:hypothetical protein [Candidatus Buchananbacteria bacterium]